MTPLIFLTLATTFAYENIEVTPLQSDTGIYLQKLGTLQNIVSHWNLIIFKDTTPLMRTLQNTQKLTYKLKLLETKLNSTDRHFIHSLTVEKTVKDITQDLKNLMESFPKNRVKRGWFDIIGKALHTLFGTVDADEEKEIINAITQIQDANKNTLTLLDKSIHVMEDTIKNFNDTLSELQTSESKINSNFQRIELAITKNSMKIDNIEIQNDLLQLNILITEILMDLEIQIQSIKDQLLFANTGILPPSIFGNEQLFKEINNLQLGDLKFPYALSLENIYKYTKFNKIVIATKDAYLIYYIQIPLITKNVFTLYQLHPVPIKHDHLYKTIIPNYIFVAIDRSNSLYSTFHFKSELTKIDNDYFGKDITTVSLQTNKICETELILNKQYSKSCDMLISPMSHETSIRLQKNIWLILLTQSSLFTYKCQNSDIHSFKIENSTLIKLNSICSGYLDNGIKLTTYKNNSCQFNESFEEIPIFNDCCLTEIEKSQKLQLQPIHLQNLNQEEITLNKHRLQQLEKDVTKERMRKFTELTHDRWWILFVSGITTILMTLCCCYCCCPQCLRMFQPIQGGCGRCIRIINNNVQRFPKRRSSYKEPTPIQLSNIVRQSLPELRNETVPQEQRIMLSEQLEEKVPSVWNLKTLKK